MGIGSLPRFLHGGYFGARGIKTSRGRESAVTSAGNSSFPNSPPRLTLNQTLRRKGRRSPSQSFQSGRAWGSPKPIRRIQVQTAPREDARRKGWAKTRLRAPGGDKRCQTLAVFGVVKRSFFSFKFSLSKTRELAWKPTFHTP